MLLSCKAGGHPMPRIKWRREDGSTIRQGDGRQAAVARAVTVVVDWFNMRAVVVAIFN